MYKIGKSEYSNWNFQLVKYKTTINVRGISREVFNA